ncbi:MAG TPA: DUF4344 domain-containing metallopeptidase [Longimicrobium sp.]|nr:DUF4344 domain-containing metallopeptidase [Longimicrobium sp.]
MRIARSLAAAAALLALSSTPAAGQGRWLTAYAPTEDPVFSQMRALFSQQDMLASMTDPLNEHFRLPRDVTLELAECGRSGAFYDPSRPAVQLCYELLMDLVEELGGENGDDALFVGAFSYVVLHQLGHAVIDVMDLPVSVPPEEAADQFAFVMAGMAAGVLDDMVQGTLALHELGLDWENPGSGQAALSDTRMRTLACLAYGSDMRAGDGLVKSGVLTPVRARGCEAEFEAVQEAWVGFLTPHLVDG